MSKLAKAIADGVKELTGNRRSKKAAKPVTELNTPRAQAVADAPELKDIREYIGEGEYGCKACGENFSGVDAFNAHAKEKHGAVENTHASPVDKKAAAKAAKREMAAAEKAAKTAKKEAQKEKDAAARKTRDEKKAASKAKVDEKKAAAKEVKEKAKAEKKTGTTRQWFSAIFGTKQLSGGPYPTANAGCLAVSNNRTENGSKVAEGCYKRTEKKGKDGKEVTVYVIMSAAYAEKNGYILPAKN